MLLLPEAAAPGDAARVGHRQGARAPFHGASRAGSARLDPLDQPDRRSTTTDPRYHHAARPARVAESHLVAGQRVLEVSIALRQAAPYVH